ncbi:MAG: DICT sensory domain-containing protein [Marmoricola sp.]
MHIAHLYLCRSDRRHAIVESEPPTGLSITELAARTGVPAATLRSWEARHGAPSPRRLSGGHRRYDEHDVALVEDVLRRRTAGLTLQAAIADAGARIEEPESSIFAGLRRRHPELETRVMSKATLLAMTRAMEDECCARAQRPVLFASFQRQRFYRQSQARWAELSRTAQVVVVFADFMTRSAAERDMDAEPLKVVVPADAPLRREWALVCDAPDYPACVAGWERPDQDGVVDADRRFEALWTVEPRAVREAAHICRQLTHAYAPELDHALAGLPTSPPAEASPDLRRATGLLTRMVGYLDDART